MKYWGEKAKTIRSGWYDKEFEEATKRKNLAYKEMIQKHHTRNSEERYIEERREEKKIHRRKKKIYFEERLQRIEELNTQKESRNFYKLINNMRKDFKPRISAFRKKNGEITNDTNEILDTWKEHFKELLDGEDQAEGRGQPNPPPRPQATQPNPGGKTSKPTFRGHKYGSPLPRFLFKVKTSKGRKGGDDDHRNSGPGRRGK
ncbi:hypothetical protein C0J52_22729 [Blattella germanica]|nr:hypothetical protein C0J52_22729 [Blattella germanica]